MGEQVKYGFRASGAAAEKPPYCLRCDDGGRFDRVVRNGATWKCLGCGGTPGCEASAVPAPAPSSTVMELRPGRGAVAGQMVTDADVAPARLAAGCPRRPDGKHLFYYTEAGGPWPDTRCECGMRYGDVGQAAAPVAASPPAHAGQVMHVLAAAGIDVERLTGPVDGTERVYGIIGSVPDALHLAVARLGWGLAITAPTHRERARDLDAAATRQKRGWRS